MKTRILIVSVMLTSLSVSGQEWIGSQFTLDTVIGLHSEQLPEDPNHILCRM